MVVTFSIVLIGIIIGAPSFGLMTMMVGYNILHLTKCLVLGESGCFGFVVDATLYYVLLLWSLCRYFCWSLYLCRIFQTVVETMLEIVVLLW